MATLRVGVVGLGLGRYHLDYYAQAPEVGRLVVCDADEARLAEEQRRQPRIAAAYTDLAAMLAAEQLDAVSIVTPDHLHRRHAEEVLAAGCHVLLTKPLATNLEDGRAIVRAAEASDRIFMVAHERRFRSRILALPRASQVRRLG